MSSTQQSHLRVTKTPMRFRSTRAPESCHIGADQRGARGDVHGRMRSIACTPYR